MGERGYFVYILRRRPRVLYVGVTSDVFRRVLRHRNQAGKEVTRRIRSADWFTANAAVGVRVAIEREEQLKGWKRAKKIALIEKK